MTRDNTLTITQNTWIISDTHFFHENIGRYCNRPENWQELIIKNWNNLISPDESVLHLGDFALGKKSNFELLTSSLNGRLFLIQGNHDRLSQSFCEAHGVILIKNSLQVELENQIKLIFSHRPIVPLEDGWINLHGHIHNVPLHNPGQGSQGIRNKMARDSEACRPPNPEEGGHFLRTNRNRWPGSIGIQ